MLDEVVVEPGVEIDVLVDVDDELLVLCGAGSGSGGKAGGCEKMAAIHGCFRLVLEVFALALGAGWRR